MKKGGALFLQGILAGISISLGGWLSLKVNQITGNCILGAFLFTIGLILIVNFSFYLYTGKVCYLYCKENTDKVGVKLLKVLIGLLGNALGAFLMGVIIHFCFINTDSTLFTQLNTMVDTKINYEWYKILILSFFCGMLVYLAVEGFKKIENNFGKYVVLVLCIAGFIICGFEHCIANMFYYALNLSFSLQTIYALVLCIIGNSIGGLFIPLCTTLINKLNDSE